MTANASHPSPFTDPHWAARFNQATTDDERMSICWSYLRASLKHSTKNPTEKDTIRQNVINAMTTAIQDAWQ